MNKLSNSGSLLMISEAAGADISSYFGIGRMDYPPNRVEQGGWLVGRYVRKEERTVQALAEYFFPAVNAIGTAAYLDWPAMENIRLQRKFFQLQDELAASDPEAAKQLALLGWIHSHPNNLPVFLSGTDMENIRDNFNNPAQFSVVLNPHREILKTFLGPAALEVPSILVPSPAAPVLPEPDGKRRRKGLRPSRNYGKRKNKRRKGKRGK